MAPPTEEKVLPRTQSQAGPGKDSASEARDRQRTGRILAADDQPHILEALELLLRPAGFAGRHCEISRGRA